MMEQKQKETARLRQRLRAAMALPQQLDEGAPQLTLDGDRQLTIQRHKGLLEYGEARIRVAAKPFEICVTGDRMLLRAMDSDCICIGGQIFSVEYQYRERTE